MVLALLGDNPMQSEFACHIGMRGKFFCRSCWVKGKDVSAEQAPKAQGASQAEGDNDNTEAQSDDGSTAGSQGSSIASGDVEGEASTSGKKGKTSKRTGPIESFGVMLDRIKGFVKVRSRILYRCAGTDSDVIVNSGWTSKEKGGDRR